MLIFAKAEQTVLFYFDSGFDSSARFKTDNGSGLNELLVLLLFFYSGFGSVQVFALYSVEDVLSL